MKAAQRIKVLKTDAQVLRYCGFNARADYQMMEIVVKTPMFQWEATELQSKCDSAIRVPLEYLKDSSEFAAR